MTSHFESCKGHAEERMKQLRVVMQRMREASDDVTVLFGGDTNLRDTEVSHLSLQSHAVSALESCTRAIAVCTCLVISDLGFFSGGQGGPAPYRL